MGEPVSNVYAFPARFQDDGSRWEPLLSKRQLAAAIGRSTRWIEQRHHDGLPCSIGAGGYRQYRLSEVLGWMDARERSA